MSDKFNVTQAQVIDRDNRLMAASGSGVDPMSTILNLLFAVIDTGNIGITADAHDVDSIAKGGGAFGDDSGTTSGLNFGYRAGFILVGQTVKTIAAGTILLAASNTNYVEVNPAGGGSVTSNTSGFTAGRVPLYVVVTGVSSVSTVTINKVLMVAPAAAATTGAMLSTPGATKEIEIPLGDLSATAAFSLLCPPIAGTLTGARIVTKTAVTADDTNYWTFAISNKTQASTAMLAATAANTTKATGGSAMVAYTVRALTLHGTAGNLVNVASDCLEFTATKTAAATTMQQCTLVLEFGFTG